MPAMRVVVVVVVEEEEEEEEAAGAEEEGACETRRAESSTARGGGSDGVDARNGNDTDRPELERSRCSDAATAAVVVVAAPSSRRGVEVCIAVRRRSFSRTDLGSRTHTR